MPQSKKFGIKNSASATPEWMTDADGNRLEFGSFQDALLFTKTRFSGGWASGNVAPAEIEQD